MSRRQRTSYCQKLCTARLGGGMAEQVPTETRRNAQEL